MAVAAFPSWMLISLLFLGTPLSLPLSLPPLPEDPTLARMAPEQCLWYFALSGVEKPDAASKNKVEQLLAEHDVQRFMHYFVAKLEAALANATPNDPAGKVLGAEGPKLIKTLLTRPMCAYIANVSPGPRGPTLRAGLAVNLGENAVTMKTSLEKIEQTLLAAGGKPPEVTADGWHKLPTPSDAPPVQWGIKDNYLLVGTGEGEAETLFGRRGKSAPDWLTNLRGKLPIERPAMVHYVNVQTLTGMAQTVLAGLQGPERSRELLERLGLQNVKYYASVSGLEKDGYTSRALLATDGQATGLLSLVGGQPLSPESLAPIPADASFALAARVNANKALEALLAAIVVVEPRAPAEIDRGLEHMARETGVHLKNDLIASLGDTWCLYNSPGDGGLVITGLTLTATIRDREKLLQANDRFAAIASRAMVQSQARFAAEGPGRRPRGASIAQIEYRGTKIHFVNFVGAESPISPAWCITDKHLVVSLYPQMIKAYLDRQSAAPPATATPGKLSLAGVPEVAQQFSTGSGPTVLVYQDTPKLFELVYPLAQIFAQFAFSELQREGVDVNIGMFPNARSIAPHLTPNISVVQATKEGIRIESHGTLPMGVGSLPLLAMPIGLLSARATVHPIPPQAIAVALDPAAAAKQQSIVNLRKLALAMHNHEAAFKTFPSATGAGKDGKPLLSWRVRLLQFIDGQQKLFQEFNHDEPWDSEHNKKLIEKMPDVYKAPGSKAAAEFKTVYLTPRGANTAFPADRAISFRNIPDGTSATIMLVEAANHKAVIWTKPDDWEFDEKIPIAGLVGLRDGEFLAALCDGSVRALSQNIDMETLRRLFIRNDGQLVKPEELGDR